MNSQCATPMPRWFYQPKKTYASIEAHVHAMISNLAFIRFGKKEEEEEKGDDEEQQQQQQRTQ